MKCNPNFQCSRCLFAGIALNAAYLCAADLIKVQSPPVLALLGLVEGLAVALMLMGLLHATPKGQALLERVCRWKHDALGKGEA